MPNALVATTTGVSPAMNARCASARGLAVHARVVGRDVDAQLAADPRRRLLGLLAGARVDDRRQRPGLAQQRHRRLLLGARRGDRDDVVGEVRPVEAGGDPLGSRRPSRRMMSPATRGVAVAVAAKMERAPSARGDVAEAEVVGPEVVAPLADAVRLVDDEQPDVRLAQPLDEPRGAEALRRHVEHLRAAVERAPQRLVVVGAVALGVDQLGAAVEAADLVDHQRDQRRDDHRQPVVAQRRQLVADRLARAGRHHQQHVAPLHRRLDRALAGRGGTPGGRGGAAAPLSARSSVIALMMADAPAIRPGRSGCLPAICALARASPRASIGSLGACRRGPASLQGSPRSWCYSPGRAARPPP